MSRTGGRTLGGVERATQTDTGYWQAEIEFLIRDRNAWKVWKAIETELNGRTGVVAILMNEKHSAPYVGGIESRPVITNHSDGTSFSDGAGYRTRSIDLKMGSAAPVGSTVVTLEAVNAGDDLTGVTFSYQYAAYETGSLISKSGDLWQMRVFPPIRQAIPAGADLECDDPMCLMHLMTDTGMDAEQSPDPLAKKTVHFNEAVDFWADLLIS